MHLTALIVALEEFFGRVQVFGTDLALVKYCQKEGPSERADQPTAEMVRIARRTVGNQSMRIR